MRFEWETTEDTEAEGWANPAAAAPPGRRWLWLLPFLFLVVAAVWAGWQLLQRQLRETTAELEQEVRSAHSLVALATREDDLELLTSMLSGREPAWTAAQKQRLEANLLLGETPSLLGWETTANGTVQAVTFSADLDEALLVTEYDYAATGNRAPLRLRQTHVYRRGQTHWLLSPPAADFWGPQRSVTAGTFVLTFAERDETFARRLLPALTVRVEDICALLAAPCVFPEQVRVRLDAEPGTVLKTRDLPVVTTMGVEKIRLPSPSLLGEPAGEEAQAALVDGYAAVVLASLINDMSGYRCCAGRVFQEALLAHQVRLLGLSPWTRPLENEDYLDFVDAPFTLADFGRVWADQKEDPESFGQAVAFVRFLLAERRLEVADLHYYLTLSDSFRDWLDQIESAAAEAEWQPWETAWLNYLYRQANQVWGEPPEPPGGHLQLVCQGGGDEAGLFSYQVATGRWEEKLLLTGDYPALMPAPGDRGVFLFDTSPRELTRLGTTWWNRGETMTFDAPGADVIWRPNYTAMEDPQGRYVTMSRITTDEPIPEGLALFDMSACDSTGCEWRAIPGRPLWSPDGTRLLLQTNSGRWLQGGREATMWDPVPVARAGQAFWTGTGEIGFVTPDRQQLTFPEGHDVPVDALLAHLPAAGRGGRWRITTVVRVEPGTDTVLVALAKAASETEQLFLLEDGGSRITLLLALEDGSFAWRSHKALSVDRRWLVLFPFGGPEMGPRFILYDLRARQAVVEAQSTYNFGFHAFDWAQDGWLARLAPQAVELIAPAGFGAGTPFRHFIPTSGLHCSSLAWVEGS